jgi:hypothetical protein
MSKSKQFDNYDDDDKYYQRKKTKMKTLRNDEKFGSIFEKTNKIKNLDPAAFDDDEDDYNDEYEDRYTR